MYCSLMHTDAIQNRYLICLCENQNYIHLDHKLLYQMLQSRNGGTQTGEKNISNSENMWVNLKLFWWKL